MRCIQHLLLEIKTPKGLATKTNKKIRPLIMPFKTKHKTWTSPDDDVIYWEIHDDSRKVERIFKNVAMFEGIIKGTFEHKLMREYGIPKLSKEDQDELKEMLEQHTTVKVIKRAEMIMPEPNGQTWWEKIKSKFRGEDQDADKTTKT